MTIKLNLGPDSVYIQTLIINGREWSPLPMPSGQPLRIHYSPRTTDAEKGKLDFSGVVKGKKKARMNLTIQIFFNDLHKPPKEIIVQDLFSDQGTCLFMTSVSLPKTGGGFQGGRTGM